MEKKSIAFVIMQIGNPELDKIYEDIFKPAIKAASLKPKRIDQDNTGYILKKEITDYIENAEIIVADITNERPNCYLEIGYAMGLDKYKNLIFTVREDHHPESENFVKGGPKIHFDISGYDILFWSPKELDEFKNKLTDKINRRLVTISPTKKELIINIWDKDWLKAKREYVSQKFEEYNLERQMEILVSPANAKFNLSQNELLKIADESQIMTFGWPIGIIYRYETGLKPLPKSDGILSEIIAEETKHSFDYSYFKKNGQIFIAKSLFEDPHYPDSIIQDARIKRTTELLMYISRYYSRCKLSPNEIITLEIGYKGLLDNQISFAPHGRSLRPLKSSENESKMKIDISLTEIERKLPELVLELVNGLFNLFDFHEVTFEYVNSIVEKYIEETNKTRR
jgi:hypothetical protein